MIKGRTYTYTTVALEVTRHASGAMAVTYHSSVDSSYRRHVTVRSP